MNNFYYGSFANVPQSLNISLSERIILTSAMFVNFIFYGVLNVGFYFGIHSTSISAGMRLFVLVCSGFLFIKSLINKDFPKFNWGVYSIFIYSFLALFMVLIFQPAELSVRYGASYGKMFDLYNFFCYPLASFLLFFQPPHRISFLIRNPILIYLPTLFSALVVAFFSLNVIQDYYMWAFYGGINRATLKQPIAMLFIMSLFYALFSKRFLSKLVLGFGGLALAFYGIYGASSQSLILSSGLILIVAFIISFRDKRAFSTSIVLGVLIATVALPYLFLSTGFERLANLANFSEAYLLGSGVDTSRIDLALSGLDLFLSSPVIGGNAYLPNGIYTHLFLVDILMATGIVGFSFATVVFYFSAKGALSIAKNFKIESFWLLLFSAFYISQFFLHGDLLSIISIPFGILLSVSLLNKGQISSL